ncbi:MAG: TRAP transporter substrate-binding protein DctP [Pseudomonadota bacterium]
MSRLQIRWVVWSALIICWSAGHAQELKLATLAPDGSSWMESFRAAADAVEEQTDGTVRIRFYPGGVMGDSATVLRRIRLGQLHGGAFTLGDLASVAAETNLYSLPFQFRNGQELAALRGEFDPIILAALREGGMIAPAISSGGFAYLFSTIAIETTEDVDSDLRAWVPSGDDISRRTLEGIGATAVPMTMAEVYTGLQTGTINTFANTPSGAIILQWHSRASHMLDLPVLMTFGTIAVDRRAFERMSEAHQAIFMREVGQAIRQQEASIEQENAEARTALTGQGIQIIQPSPTDIDAWQQQSKSVLQTMLDSGDLEIPSYDRLIERLQAMRAQ